MTEIRRVATSHETTYLLQLPKKNTLYVVTIQPFHSTGMFFYVVFFFSFFIWDFDCIVLSIEYFIFITLVMHHDGRNCMWTLNCEILLFQGLNIFVVLLEILLFLFHLKLSLSSKFLLCFSSCTFFSLSSGYSSRPTVM